MRDRHASGTAPQRPVPAFARCASLLASELRPVDAVAAVGVGGGLPPVVDGDAADREPASEEVGVVDSAWASAVREATRGVVAGHRPSGAVRAAPLYDDGDRAGTLAPPGGETRLDRRG